VLKSPIVLMNRQLMGARRYYLSEMMISCVLGRLLAMCTGQVLVFFFDRPQDGAHVSLPMSASHAIGFGLITLSRVMNNMFE
jgi:hypothetical protein